jgi:hypothetical protein
MRFVGIIIFAALIAMPLLSCEDDFLTTESAVMTNDAGQTLKLTVSPDNLDVFSGGACTVLVELYAPDGSAIERADILVTSTIGALTENTMETDVDGIAVTALSATGTAGYSVVVATYKSMQVIVSVDFWEGDPSGSAESGGGVDIGDEDTTPIDEGAEA